MLYVLVYKLIASYLKSNSKLNLNIKNYVYKGMETYVKRGNIGF